MHIMAIHWVNCVSDIDERAGLNSGCHHDRKNTIDSYHCLCQSRYMWFPIPRCLYHCCMLTPCQEYQHLYV